MLQLTDRCLQMSVCVKFRSRCDDRIEIWIWSGVAANVCCVLGANLNGDVFCANNLNLSAENAILISVEVVLGWNLNLKN